MQRKLLMGGLIAFALGTTSPALAQSAGEILKGTAIGAGGGAVAGAVLPGLSAGDGALIGAAGGAAITVLTDKNRKWKRDRYGRSYYVNKRGNRVYKQR